MPSHSSKKRKREENGTLETSKPSAIFQASGHGRHCTLSIALPGSIISNAQSHDLKTALAGQIARAAAVFCVDEIVIYNDGNQLPAEQQQRQQRNDDRPQHRHSSRAEHAVVADSDEHTGWSDPDHFLCHLLSYLECPPHLRRSLFPMHPNLRTAGSLPSLDMPHHLRANEWCEYREGVTTEPTEDGDGTLAEAGLKAPIELVDVSIPPKTRVTLKLPPQPAKLRKAIRAEAVAPSAPREDAGFYWGYQIRPCSSLSAVFTECPFENGYDVSIGTSERGRRLEEVLPASFVAPAFNQTDHDDSATARLPEEYSHLMVVFGGVAGLEAAAAADNELSDGGITGANVNELFDAWVNVCPGQGSRTIRTEEAVWLGLQVFKTYVEHSGRREASTEIQVGNAEESTSNSLQE